MAFLACQANPGHNPQGNTRLHTDRPWTAQDLKISKCLWQTLPFKTIQFKIHKSYKSINSNDVLLLESAGLPACLIGRCCSCFCSWLVLVPLLSCCAFLLRLNQVHPPPLPCTSNSLGATFYGRQACRRQLDND